MPKASFATKDAQKGGFGMQEGNAEVIGSLIRVHQYPVSSKTGKQAPRFICEQLQLAHLDKDWNRKEEDEPEFVEYGLGRDKIKILPGKDDCDCKFHVGLATSADDPNPKDLGHEVGTEGNCVCVIDETARIHEKAKQQQLMNSLEEKGFKPGVLDKGFAPDLIGLRAHFHTVTSGKFQGDDGTESDVKVLLVDRIQQYPYDVKATTKSKGKASATAETGATQKVNGQEAGNTEARMLATSVFNKVAVKFKGKEGVARSDFQKELLTQMTLDRVKVVQQKPVLELARDDDQLVELAAGTFLLDPETNTLNFT